MSCQQHKLTKTSLKELNKLVGPHGYQGTRGPCGSTGSCGPEGLLCSV